MLHYRDGRITKTLLVAFFLILAGYGYYELRGIVFGPRIEITTDTHETTDSFIFIEGHAEHIASLSMNGHPISVTEDGYFEEPYLLAPGINRIILDAEDTYGQTRQEVVRIVYTPPENASSTPPVLSPGATTTVSASSTPMAPALQ